MFDLDFEYEFESVSKQGEFINSNQGDVASLAGNYCSLIIRVSQTSSPKKKSRPEI